MPGAPNFVLISTTRECSECHKQCPIGEFAKVRSRTRLPDACKHCRQLIWSRRYYAANRERAKAATYSWTRRNKDAYARTVKNSKLKRFFGIDLAEYGRMLAAQNGVCAICRRINRGKFARNPLGVDHCHKTGKVRGLLCHQCNFAIGQAGDDPMVLRAAADYLERTR